MATPSFDWTQYVRLADQLSMCADEASQRSSISRAYYAVFHAATFHAKTNGYSGRSHGRLWKTYQCDSERNCRKLSAIANSMKRAREQADYETNVPRIDEIMAQQLKDAAKFTTMLATVPIKSPQPLPPSPVQMCPFCLNALP